MNFELLKNPPKKYRPAPFWSWNEKLDTDETRKQITEMDKAGMGGYFMHARGGLQTEYLSDDWFDNINAAIDQGEKCGMLSWGYDENGWPSGFGNGVVNSLGEKYQQKFLRCEKTKNKIHSQHTITNLLLNGENLHFYYDVNPYYVDTLNSEVTDEFIKSTHKVYKDTLREKFSQLSGFFTDEPQVSRSGLPWSLILEEEFLKAYGYSVIPHLAELFYQTGNWRKTRYHYFKLIRDLFAENYTGRIYKWCKKNGTHLTGHMTAEEGWIGHILSNGSCMPNYEYMDIPGMDHLGRSLASVYTMVQLASVANQLGKKQILSETFALSGWNVSFEDLRYIYEMQMSHGINLLCQHLEGYSLRGIRKRDYPASLFKHQPWWKDYRLFNDAVSRVGMLIAEGEVNCKTLILHNIETCWVNFDLEKPNIIRNIFNDMKETMTVLESVQIPYHLGDERIMKRYGSVENGLLKIGTQSYNTVIIPPSVCYSDNTYNLINEFVSQGGRVIFTGQIPNLIEGEETDNWNSLAQNCIITDNQSLVAELPDENKPISLSGSDTSPVSCCVRSYKDKGITMYYLFNSSEQVLDLAAETNGESATLFNMYTGEEEPVSYTKKGSILTTNLTLPSRGSAIIFVYENIQKDVLKKQGSTLLPITDKINGEWTIKSVDSNALTLDYCDVYFNDRLHTQNIPVSDVQEIACAFGKQVKTETIFSFTVKNDDFSKCCLVLETPEIFHIKVNGNEIDKKIIGTYHDNSFKIIDIHRFVKTGDNKISLTCNFVQKAQTYEKIKKATIFETEKNNLSYDMEIEAIYLLGDFAVKTDSAFEEIERDALRTNGDFYLTCVPKTVNSGDLATQGFPFFAGDITLKKTVSLTKEECFNRCLEFSKLGATVTNIKVNGKALGKIMWQPYTADLSNVLKEGENTFEITLTTNLRNLLGPFHLKVGESISVCPGDFFHNSPIWCKGENSKWTDSYCFVKHGLFFN